MRGRILGVLIFATFAATPPLRAQTTISFDALNDGDAVTTQYSGLTFANAQALMAGFSLNDLDYPAHSGKNAITDTSGPISIAFSAAISAFSGYFTHVKPITVTALDSNGNLLATTTSSKDNAAVSGDGSAPNELLSLTGTNIATIVITGNPNGNSLIADDLSYTIPVPPPCGGSCSPTPPQSNPLTVSPTILTVNAPVGGPPVTQAVILSYQTQTQGAPTYSSNVNTTQCVGWLSVSPSSGTMTEASFDGTFYHYTATATIGADPTGLVAGATCSGTANFIAGIGAASVSPVTLNVLAPSPALLSVSPTVESFSVAQGGAPLNGQVTVSNAGGGTLQFTTQATSGGGWLKLTGSGSGAASAGSLASLAFTMNPANLTAGVYYGRITVSAANSPAPSVVSVVLTVAKAAPSIQISKIGVALTAVAGGAAPQAQTVTVANSGAGSLRWNTQTSTTSGGNWLTVTPASGTSVGGQVGTAISISANASVLSGLTAGQYYGSVNVMAANAVNSPQTVSVVLNVLEASPGVTVSAGGVLLVGAAGSTTAVQQAVGLFNPSSSEISYTASAFTQNGAAWLSVNPASGTINAGANSIQIAASLSGLSPGLQNGTVTLNFGGGSSATIQVVALVLGSSVASLRGGAAIGVGLRPTASATGCPGGKASFLIPIFREPASQSSVQVAAAATVQMQVIDDCGNAVTAAAGGSVQVSFINNSGGTGDQGINLTDIGSGIWEGTWAPVNAAASVTLQVAATEGGLTVNSSLSALSSVMVSVAAASVNAAPQPTGIANAASAAQAVPEVVGPGSYVAIYGTGLAGNGSPSATTLPLQTTLNGTQLFLGGLPMPLLYAAAGQVNALVPQGIAPDATYPLVVVRGTTQSVPVALTVAELQPGIYTVNTLGSGAGIVTNALTGQLITVSNPAHVGDYLAIYGTGLGSAQAQNGQPEPPDGAGVPTTPLFYTTATVTATIGGISAPVTFSGLTSMFAALYQVNVQVPAGVTPGNTVALVINATDPVTGATTVSNSVTIVVQ